MKAFHTVFAQHMDSCKLRDEPLTIVVACDDEPAKKTVLALAADIGFDAVD